MFCIFYLFNHVSTFHFSLFSQFSASFSAKLKLSFEMEKKDIEDFNLYFVFSHKHRKYLQNKFRFRVEACKVNLVFL